MNGDLLLLLLVSTYARSPATLRIPVACSLCPAINSTFLSTANTTKQTSCCLLVESRASKRRSIRSSDEQVTAPSAHKIAWRRRLCSLLRHPILLLLTLTVVVEPLGTTIHPSSRAPISTRTTLLLLVVRIPVNACYNYERNPWDRPSLFEPCWLCCSIQWKVKPSI